MTAARLARHYPALKPDERLSLMLAAAARGDDVEHERLTAAATGLSFTTLHTFPRAIAFREVLDRVRAERLSLAARFFHARFAAVMARGRERELMVGLALTYGYLLLTHREGWTRFCAEQMLPSGGLDEHLAGGEALAAAERDAEADGALGADVEAFYRRAGEEPPGPLKTASSVAGEFAATFAARLAWWEGEGR